MSVVCDVSGDAKRTSTASVKAGEWQFVVPKKKEKKEKESVPTRTTDTNETFHRG